MKKEHMLFLVVGIANTAIDFIALNFFAAVVGLDTLVANVIAVTIAMIFSYVANQYLVFESDKKDVKQLGRFLSVNFVSAYLVQTLVIAGLIVWWKWPLEQMYSVVEALELNMSQSFVETNGSKAVAVVVAGVFSWYAYKNFVFKGVKK